MSKLFHHLKTIQIILLILSERKLVCGADSSSNYCLYGLLQVSFVFEIWEHIWEKVPIGN